MEPGNKAPNYEIEEYKTLRTEMMRHMESLDRNVIATNNDGSGDRVWT